MTTISAKTILRSRNLSKPDCVVSTLLLRYPRFIHAEFMTHRAISRNAASSRAIPVAKIIDDILTDTAMPIHWGKNQKGMQADEECDASIDLQQYFSLTREKAWLVARDNAIAAAEAFSEAGYHKQVVNRLLEPFMHITVLATATEWDNFLELRDHPDAEPHIQMLAREIRKELERDDNITDLKPGEWHLPFTYEEKDERPISTDINDLIKLSVARCASTSYKTVDGFDMTLERAIALHDKLVAARPIHASPAEHACQADTLIEDSAGRYWDHESQHRNFVGFRQYRAMLETVE